MSIALNTLISSFVNTYNYKLNHMSIALNNSTVSQDTNSDSIKLVSLKEAKVLMKQKLDMVVSEEIRKINEKITKSVEFPIMHVIYIKLIAELLFEKLKQHKDYDIQCDFFGGYPPFVFYIQEAKSKQEAKEN